MVDGVPPGSFDFDGGHSDLAPGKGTVPSAGIPSTILSPPPPQPSHNSAPHPRHQTCDDSLASTHDDAMRRDVERSIELSSVLDDSMEQETLINDPNASFMGDTSSATLGRHTYPSVQTINSDNASLGVTRSNTLGSTSAGTSSLSPSSAASHSHSATTDATSAFGAKSFAHHNRDRRHSAATTADEGSEAGGMSEGASSYITARRDLGPASLAGVSALNPPPLSKSGNQARSLSGASTDAVTAPSPRMSSLDELSSSPLSSPSGAAMAAGGRSTSSGGDLGHAHKASTSAMGPSVDGKGSAEAEGKQGRSMRGEGSSSTISRNSTKRSMEDVHSKHHQSSSSPLTPATVTGPSSSKAESNSGVAAGGHTAPPSTTRSSHPSSSRSTTRIYAPHLPSAPGVTPAPPPAMYWSKAPIHGTVPRRAFRAHTANLSEEILWLERLLPRTVVFRHRWVRLARSDLLCVKK